MTLFCAVILDANEECHEANFLIGAATTTTRVWDIKVTQYSCGEETLSGLCVLVNFMSKQD
jgi:hypothetical protein